MICPQSSSYQQTGSGCEPKSPGSGGLFPAQTRGKSDGGQEYRHSCAVLGNSPQRYQILIPGTSNAILYGKIILEVTKLRPLRGGDNPGLAGWAQWNLRGAFEKEI